MNHNKYLQAAIAEAKRSADEGGIAAGAALVKIEEVVAVGRDQTRQTNNPVAVAEVDCIRQAGRRNDQQDLILYTSRYPDMLAAGTILQFSIGALVIGQKEIENPVINLLKEKNIPVTFHPIGAISH